MSRLLPEEHFSACVTLFLASPVAPCSSPVGGSGGGSGGRRGGGGGGAGGSPVDAVILRADHHETLCCLFLALTVRRQLLFTLNYCLPSTVCPQLFALN